MRAVCWRRWPRPDTVHVCRLINRSSCVFFSSCGLQLSAPSSAIPIRPGRVTVPLAVTMTVTATAPM